MASTSRAGLSKAAEAGVLEFRHRLQGSLDRQNSIWSAGNTKAEVQQKMAMAYKPKSSNTPFLDFRLHVVHEEEPRLGPQLASAVAWNVRALNSHTPYEEIPEQISRIVEDVRASDGLTGRPNLDILEFYRFLWHPTRPLGDDIAMPRDGDNLVFVSEIASREPHVDYGALRMTIEKMLELLGCECHSEGPADIELRHGFACAKWLFMSTCAFSSKDTEDSSIDDAITKTPGFAKTLLEDLGFVHVEGSRFYRYDFDLSDWHACWKEMGGEKEDKSNFVEGGVAAVDPHNSALPSNISSMDPSTDLLDWGDEIEEGETEEAQEVHYFDEAFFIGTELLRCLNG